MEMMTIERMTMREEKEKKNWLMARNGTSFSLVRLLTIFFTSHNARVDSMSSFSHLSFLPFRRRRVRDTNFIMIRNLWCSFPGKVRCKFNTCPLLLSFIHLFYSSKGKHILFGSSFFLTDVNPHTSTLREENEERSLSIIHFSTSSLQGERRRGEIHSLPLDLSDCESWKLRWIRNECESETRRTETAKKKSKKGKETWNLHSFQVSCMETRDQIRKRQVAGKRQTSIGAHEGDGE